MPDLVGMWGADLSGAAQEAQRAVVVALGADAAEHRANGLDVVVEDGRAGVEDGAEGVVVALEVGDEHLDGAAGQHVVDALDALGEDRRAAVRQVLSGDGGDDAVAQLKLPHGLCEASRFLGVEG